MLLGNRHIIDLHVRVDIKAVLVADVLDLLACIVQVKLALQAEDDILGGGEQVDQLEVLVDHADTQIEGILGRCDGHRLVVDVDLPLVGEVDAGEHIHQRGLAAAVLAQQGQDLAFVQFKVYIFVCDDLAAEPLGDVLHSDRAFLFQGCHPFFRRRWLQHLEYAGDKFHTTYSTIHGERCKSKSAKNLSGIYKECEVTQERVILFV